MTSHTDPPDEYTGDVDEREDEYDEYGDEPLPCGRLLSRVRDAWERQPAGATDPHPRTCPHCRAAVRGLDELESAVGGLRDETKDASAYDATPLTERVMDVVRLELRPGRPLPLGEPAEDLWIMEAVAARALRAAAETVPGVRAGSCRLFLRPAATSAAPASARAPASASASASASSSPSASASVSGSGTASGLVVGAGGGTVEVRLDVHAPVGVPLRELADQVRRRVREAADRQLGMDVAAVDIRIGDLIDSAEDPMTGSQEGRDR